jgi:thiopeptide-type bacteriocin biosynthesis protein
MNTFNLYESAHFFMVRTALLPFETYPLFNQERDSKRKLLDFYQSHELFQEAIAIASPALHQALQTLIQDFSSQGLDKVYQGLLKYFLRMCSRTTPFGLFSSVGWGQFAEQIQLEFTLMSLKKRVKPDMVWVNSLLNFLHTQKGLIQHLRVIVNPLILKQRSKLCLTKSSHAQQTRSLVSIRHTPASESVLTLAKSPLLYTELENKLSLFFSQYDQKKITACLDQMFQREFLISELSICLDQPFKLSRLIDKIKAREEPLEILATLEQVDEAIKKYETSPIGQGFSLLKEALQQLNAWEKVDYPMQVDSFLDCSSLQLKHEIREHLAETATALWLLAQHPSAEESKLTRYHRLFLEKYGHNRLVPLLDLIDPVKGLGYPVEKREEVKQNNLSTLKEELFARISGNEIIVDDLVQNLWFKYQDRFVEAPLSLELYFDILTDLSKNREQGDYTLVLNPVIASVQAGNTFGRFLSLWDDASNKIETMRQFLIKEEALDQKALFVEASFLPEAPRTANVCFFSKIRQFQLCLHYHEPSQHSIDLEDLYVGATLQRLYLYSKRLKREIRVSMSSAVNPDLAPPILRFLLDVTLFRSTPFSPYIWQGLAQSPVYLPRVRYRHTILCPARWCFSLERFRLKPEANLEEIAANLKTALQVQQTPELVYLTNYDHRLLIQWSHPEHFKLLCQQLLSKGEIILFEYFTRAKQTMQSEQGSHMTEFVVPLVKKGTYATTRDIEGYPSTEQYPIENRLSIFQKKWLYTKIFLPQEEEEEFLKHYVFPFVTTLQDEKKIKKWFYIRYAEEQPHIRLRLHSDTEEEYYPLMEQLSNWNAQLLAQEIISHVSFHIYEPELERYGGLACLEEVEDVFFMDSYYCCYVMNHLNHFPDTLPLVSWTALGLIYFLNQLDGNPSSMIQFLTPLEKDMALLAGVRQQTKTILQYAHALFLPNTQTSDSNDPLLTQIQQALMGLNSSLTSYRKKLEELEEKGTLQNTKAQIIDSLLHMHCNRLLGIDSNLEKKARVIAYHLLKKISSPLAKHLMIFNPIQKEPV